MFSLEEIFVSFIDQLPQRYSHGVKLIGLRSRRIQRSLRLIEAAQGGCWTAPCSPAAPTFGEETSGQPEALIIRNACHAKVQSWRNPPILPIASELPSVTAVVHNTQDQTDDAAACGHDSLSFESAQQDIADSVSTPNTVPVNRDSSSPLSSPRTLSSVSSPLPSSPTRTSLSIDNSRDESFSAGTSLPRLGSDEVTTQHTDLQDDSDSVFRREAGGPFEQQNTTGGIRSAGDDPSTRQPSLAEVPISEKSKEDISWTKRRLRSNPGQAVKTQQDHSAEDHNTNPKTKKGTKRKRSASHEPSAAADRTSPGPLVASINQIGRTNTIAEIQEAFQDLKGRPHRLHDPAKSIQSRTPVRIDTAPARVIEITPNLAREIEGSTVNEQLSRVRSRMALADFYCAYRAAHAEPDIFLQELERSPSQHIHQPQARHRTRGAEIKHRFIELVFSQSTRETDQKRNSTRVNNWQKAGRPWFELIGRFGTGILLLVPEDVTNCRLRDMKRSDFLNFLQLVEEREPVFMEALAAANDLVKAGFLDQLSYSDTGNIHPQLLLSSPPSGLIASEATSPILPGNTSGLQAGDACSGPDLDTLLSYSFRQVAEDQHPNNILNQCYVWPSTRFDDLEGVDEVPRWSPLLQRSQRRPCRFQILPFHCTERWQLAVFDIAKNMMVCYDTAWTLGSPNSTFASLQQWFDATVGNTQEITLDCRHEKDIPVANTSKDTIVLTWWFARQLVAGDGVKSRSVHWRMETLLADRILSNQGQTTDQTIGISAEELVSPSIYSGDGGDYRSDDPCLQPLHSLTFLAALH